MSNSEIHPLNLAGQFTLSGVASMTVNAVVHPFCTLKNRIMTNVHGQRMPSQGLYRGYWAVSVVDAIALGVGYATNNGLEERTSLLFSSIAAGIISSPFVSIGEGVMANRQVNNLPYLTMLQRATRLSGLTTTIFREIPFAAAIYWFSPTMDQWFQRHIDTKYQSPTTSIIVQTFTGATGGSIAGFITTPPDLIKTKVQTSEVPLSIRREVNAILTKEGCLGLFKGAGLRSIYTGLTVAGLNIINNVAPTYFPKILKKD
jgi:hypothetical protein